MIVENWNREYRNNSPGDIYQSSYAAVVSGAGEIKGIPPFWNATLTGNFWHSEKVFTLAGSTSRFGGFLPGIMGAPGGFEALGNLGITGIRDVLGARVAGAGVLYCFIFCFFLVLPK